MKSATRQECTVSILGPNLLHTADGAGLFSLGSGEENPVFRDEAFPTLLWHTN